ncbi:MAG: hypothetical protein QOF11_798 [Chloroflexota bacterium]|jgi:hypothetical protein|nr:hypothetical protein [Chloroflexota bacterium]
MANWTPLESSWAKFHRASSHLQDLDGELRRIAGEHAEPIGIERKINAQEAFLRVTRVPEFREAGLLLGDSVNNFRAALDHLTWDLVKLGLHPRLAPKQAIQVQFPLANSAKEFGNQRGRRTPGISDAEWRIIREYQPYRRDDRGRAVRVLRELSDTDKHRFIVPAVVSRSRFVGQIRLVGCAGTGIWMCPPRRALHVGTKLVRVQITPTEPEYDVQINSQMTVQPSLGRGVPLMPSMLSVRTVTLEILSRFEELIFDETV